MKKTTVLALLLMLLPLADAAAQKLDLHSLSTLRRQAVEQKAGSRHDGRRLQSPAQGRGARIQRAFITLADGYDRSDLEAAGVEVTGGRGRIMLATVEVDRAEEIASLPCVKAMNLQKALRANMDRARADQHIDEIQLGSATTTLPRTYTGKGVCAGIVDQGFDAHHINFRYADGTSRIGYCNWTRLNAAGNALVEDGYNYLTIGDFTTDNASAYHATHTLGILGGSYNGPVSVGTAWADPTMPEPNAPLTRLDVCPYYGVAPEADLSVSCGDLQDAFVADGIEKLLNYRYFMQRPMVINLSLGSTSGPRDLRSPMAQYLDTVASEAIICMSAGNEGDLKISLTKVFAEGDTTVKSMIYPYYYQYDPEQEGSFTFRNGSIEVWSNDSTPFRLKAVIYNRKRNYREALTMPVVGNNIGTYYTSSANYQVTETDIVGNPTFVKAYEGYIGVGGKIDENTGRYYGMVDYYLINNAVTNLEDDYVIGFEIEGQPGQRIDCYGDGLNTWIDNYGQEGFADGSTDNTINDMAAAKNIIVVGSYNTRQNWLCLDGGTSRYEGDGFKTGGISGFSSYGTTSDGRALPTVCAPGAAIISSISWPYAKQMSESDINYSCSAKLVEKDRTNLWKQEVGTSMSTPFVAGSIALWLEANPTLTVNDVKEIIAQTAIVDDDVKSSDRRRWGAGKFNALGGLKEAIRRAGVNDVAMPDNDRLLLTPGGHNVYTVFVGKAAAMRVVVYAADGRLVRSFRGEGDELTADLNGLTPGVYILNANGRHSAKVLVK